MSGKTEWGGKQAWQNHNALRTGGHRRGARAKHKHTAHAHVHARTHMQTGDIEKEEMVFFFEEEARWNQASPVHSCAYNTSFVQPVDLTVLPKSSSGQRFVSTEYGWLD